MLPDDPFEPAIAAAHPAPSGADGSPAASRMLRPGVSQTSLRTRLLVAVSLTAAVVYTAISAPLYLLVRLNVTRDSDAVLREEARIIETLITGGTAPADDRLSALPLLVCSVQLTRTNGVVRARSGPVSGQMPRAIDASGRLERDGGTILETVETPAGQQIRLLTTRITLTGAPNPEAAFLQLGFSLEEKKLRLRATFWWFLMGGALLVGLTDAALLVVFSPWRRQFDDLCRNARGLDLSRHAKERLAIPTADAELAQLVDAFNGLLDRVDQAYAAQQRFVVDASHEIRTPLTILRGEIDVILRRDRDAADYREVMQSNKEELERLSRLVENMLTLARADTQDAMASRRSTDLVAVAESACKRLRPLASQNGVQLHCAPAAPCLLLGDGVALERAIVNLVENAIHYSSRGQSVEVRLQASAKEAVITVTDQGPGIPATSQARVFDRFYRIDQARARAYGGAGLGLAIVKTIAEAHGGRVGVQSEPGKGSTFWIRIPLA